MIVRKEIHINVKLKIHLPSFTQYLKKINGNYGYQFVDFFFVISGHHFVDIGSVQQYLIAPEPSTQAINKKWVQYYVKTVPLCF